MREPKARGAPVLNRPPGVTEGAHGRFPEKLKLLTFYLNDAMFGVPATDLVEVVRTGPLQAVHGASDATLGLINFHGAAAPVLNLKRLLGMQPAAPGDFNKRLAVRTDAGCACLAVDGIAGFMDAREDAHDRPASVYGPADKKYCKCYVNMGKTLLPVLDLHEILKQARGEFPETAVP